MVRLTLRDLYRKHLIAENVSAGSTRLSRRALLVKAGVTAAMLPIVHTIAAPAGL